MSKFKWSERVSKFHFDLIRLKTDKLKNRVLFIKAKFLSQMRSFSNALKNFKNEAFWMILSLYNGVNEYFV